LALKAKAATDPTLTPTLKTALPPKERRIEDKVPIALTQNHGTSKHEEPASRFS